MLHVDMFYFLSYKSYIFMWCPIYFWPMSYKNLPMQWDDWSSCCADGKTWGSLQWSTAFTCKFVVVVAPHHYHCCSSLRLEWRWRCTPSAGFNRLNIPCCRCCVVKSSACKHSWRVRNGKQWEWWRTCGISCGVLMSDLEWLRACCTHLTKWLTVWLTIWLSVCALQEALTVG